MNKFTAVFVLLLSSTIGFSQSLKELKKEVPKELSVKYDKFDQTTSIETDWIPMTASSKSSEGAWFKLVFFKTESGFSDYSLYFRYEGNDWVFADEVTFLQGTAKEVRNNDVTPIELKIKSDPSRKVKSGFVREVFYVENTNLDDLLKYWVEGGSYFAARFQGDGGSKTTTSFGKKAAKSVPVFVNYYNSKK